MSEINSFKNGVEKEIASYISRFDEDIEDQKRADTWMLLVTAIGVLKELEFVETQKNANAKKK